MGWIRRAQPSRDLEAIEQELRAQFDELVRREHAGELDPDGISRAQSILVDAASWMRGLRPARTFDEAWEEIEQLNRAGQLRDGLG